MSPSELAKEISAGRFEPLYFFYGSEDFRIKEATRAIVSKFLPRQQLATNYNQVSAAKSRIEDILTDLSVFPMLGERQVFVISDIQALSPANIEKIFATLSPTDPNRVVILTCPAAKMPRKNTKLLKILTENTTSVEFPKLARGSSISKIKSLIKPHEVEIEGEALNILAEMLGGNLGALTGEVNKLIDHVGSGGTIKKQHIAALSCDFQAFNIFELVNYAALGDFDKSMTVIDFLTKKGERPSGLLFWLGEHFIGLYLTQNQKSPTSGRKSTAWKYAGQLNRFSNEKLERIILLIADADFDLRNNVGPDRLILERLIFEICSMGKKT